MKTAHPKPKSTTFSYQAPDAEEVLLSGTFNDWAPTGIPMQRQSDGTWRTDLELEPGRYEFKFVVDGSWQCQDHAGEECVPNPFGTTNQVIVVQASANNGEQSRSAASQA